MNANATLPLYVDLHQAIQIFNHCQRCGLNPLDVLLKACGAPESEPYTFDLTKIVQPISPGSLEELCTAWPKYREPIGAQKHAYLELLSQLLGWKYELVSKVLPTVHGRFRVYFSKDASKIRNSGNNIDVHLIPGTDWYALTHLSGDKKSDTLAKVMSQLGFSWSYTRTISHLACKDRPSLCGYFKLPEPEEPSRPDAIAA